MNRHFVPAMFLALTLVPACGPRVGKGAVAAPPTAAPATPAAKAKTAPPAPKSAYFYPDARRCDVVDDYHGTKVPDPYRWLEDSDSPETRAWIEAENRLTSDYLDKLPERAPFRERLTRLWNYEKFTPPRKAGKHYFWTHNDGLQNQNVLFTAASLDAPPRVLLDPNTLAADGTVALSGWDVTDDGALLAYGLAQAGSDWVEWRVRDVATGKDRDDLIRWVKFTSPTFSHDGKSLYYARFDEPPAAQLLTAPNYYNKLYVHKLGTPQSADVLLYERKDEKELGFSPTASEDGRYLVITAWKGTSPKTQLFYLDLKAKRPKVVELLSGFDARYSYLGNDGPIFYLSTDKDAPRSRIVAVDLRHPEAAKWKQLVPERPDALESSSIVGARLILSYLHDATSLVEVHDLSGKLVAPIDLPPVTTATGFDGRRSDGETFYRYTGYLEPGAVMRYDLKTGKSALWQRAKVDFDASKYESREVFVTGKDGTRLPLFVSYKKGIPLDGSTPTFLYGYGGFSISITPSFSPASAAWMEAGGVFAVGVLRGGGEYGEAWHLAGTRANKQHVFDDFISDAEWLVKNRFTSPAKLSIGGASNGGLLVGACLTQRPDLFAAAVPQVGVMDMLRFHKFTIGWAWSEDYGNSDDPAMFPVLRAYSPLHNVKPGTRYPAVLLTTADHDDRVVPAHTFKFTATLQAAQLKAPDAPPVLIRIDTRAGHGSGKPTAKRIDEAADRFGFLLHVLGTGAKGN